MGVAFIDKHTNILSRLSSLVAVFIFLSCTLFTKGLYIVEGDVLNLGSFKSTEKSIKTKFTLMNESPKAIKVDEVMTSCGCTVAKISNTTISPGEKVSVDVTIDTKKYTGSAKRIITVKSDRGINTITLLYDVVAILSPALKVYKLDNLTIGKEKKSQIEIVNTSDQTVALNKIYSHNPELKIYSNPKKINAGDKITISFSIVPQKIGYCTAEIILDTSEGEFRFSSHGVVSVKENKK